MVTPSSSTDTLGGMDHPGAPLDYAVFHLTPTRTRFDLLVFSRSVGGGEKIASGLLEPFLSHLRCAREQIPKGGYSITLRPPSPHSPWFTKPTLERFVRFVSTPEILERVVSIEREIIQIENSIRMGDQLPASAAAAAPYHHLAADQTDQGSMTLGSGNTNKPTLPSKLKAESDSHDAECSKFCLQRVLETRKAILRKEQGMAYARASVTGFELVHTEDLLLFADAFGASRLREACLKFKELCKKKEKDKLWMDELAAMEACSQPELYMETSGIMLTSESICCQSSMPVIHEASSQLDVNVAVNDATSCSTNNSAGSNSKQDKLYRSIHESSLDASFNTINGNLQAPITWPNHPPQYTYGFQGPAAQRMTPYQGYAFPHSQFIPPYYPGHSGNMQIPPEKFSHAISQDADHQRNDRPLRSKESSLNGKSHRSKKVTLGLQDGYSDQVSLNSMSEADADMHHGVSSDRETLSSQGTQKRPSKNKSSRRVVIRNINYISSKQRDGGKDESSDESLVEDDFLDGDFLKNKVENVVDSLQKHHKSSQRQYKKKFGAPNHRKSADPVENGPDEKACVVEKSDGSWQDFQNFLMGDEKSAANDLIHEKTQHQEEVGDEYCIVKSIELTQQSVRSCTLDAESIEGINQQLLKNDSFALIEKDANIEDVGPMENFEYDDNYCSSIKRSHCEDKDLLHNRSTKTEAGVPDTLADYTNEQSSLRCQRGGDWFIVSQSDEVTEVQEPSRSSIFEYERDLTSTDVQQFMSEKNEKKLLIDDSFIVSLKPTVNVQPLSQWETDMSIVSGIMLAAESCETDNANHFKEKVGNLYACEPDDLQMVLERDSRHETFVLSCISDIAEITLPNANELKSGAETDVCAADSTPPSSKEITKNCDTEKKFIYKGLKGKPMRESLGKMKYDVLSRDRKPPIMSQAALHKSKMKKEEENRKRVEELLLERQKRIAQRTANYTTTAIAAMLKENSRESKDAIGSLNHDKHASQSTSQIKDRSKVHKLYCTNSIKDKHISGPSKQNGIIL